MTGQLRYRILGPLEIRVGGEWVEVRPAQVRLLLAVMLVNANQVVSCKRLREELWGVHPPRSAAKLIQQQIHQLRRILDDRSGEVLRTRAGGYQLVVAPEELDAAWFVELVDAAIQALPDDPTGVAARCAGEALALWRGPALADCSDTPTVELEMSRLDERRVVATEVWVQTEMAGGRHRTILPELVSLVRAHPYRELFWKHLILALYRCDRQADALAAIRDLRRLFRDELGLTPGEPVVELERAILAADPTLHRVQE